MRNTFPAAFSFFAPPLPPADDVPEGGASGIVRERSAASTVVIVISLGRGTGERLAFIIAQLRAMLSVEMGYVYTEDGCGWDRQCQSVLRSTDSYPPLAGLDRDLHSMVE